MNKNLVQSAYNKCSLLDIYLHESSLKRAKDFNLMVKIENFKQQSMQAVKADLLANKYKDNNTSFILRCYVDFGIRFVKDNSAEILAEIEATFCATYQCTEDLKDDELEEFVRFNVVHNVWPFWRSYVFKTASESKLPQPTIPLMKPKLKKNNGN